MQKSTYTSPLMADIGMSAVIFVIALLTVLGTILRIVVSCINMVSRIIYYVSDCGTRVYSNALTWHRPKSIEYSGN